MSRKFSINLETGLDLFSSNFKIDYFKHEKINFRGFYLLPSIEFSSKAIIQPIGISHQFGLGLIQSSFIQKKYHVTEGSSQSYYNYANDTSFVLNYKDNFKGETKNKFFFHVIQYTINFRTPITERILIRYGFSYNIHFRNYALNNWAIGSTNYSSLTQNNKQDISLYNNLDKKIEEKLIRSIMHFNICLTYAF